MTIDSEVRREKNMYEDDNRLSAWQIYKRRIFTPSYLWKKLALLIICRIHDFTRYKICRSFSDLFYWPDGFCADTVVVILFFAIALLSLWDDASIVASCSKGIFSDIKDVLKIGLKIMDEDEWDNLE